MGVWKRESSAHRWWFWRVPRHPAGAVQEGGLPVRPRPLQTDHAHSKHKLAHSPKTADSVANQLPEWTAGCFCLWAEVLARCELIGSDEVSELWRGRSHHQAFGLYLRSKADVFVQCHRHREILEDRTVKHIYKQNKPSDHVICFNFLFVCFVLNCLHSPRHLLEGPTTWSPSSNQRAKLCYWHDCCY